MTDNYGVKMTSIQSMKFEKFLTTYKVAMNTLNLEGRRKTAQAWLDQNSIDLFFACMGYGTTVCDRNQEERGDYLKVAHISEQRKIKYYQQIPQLFKNRIEQLGWEWYGENHHILEYLLTFYPTFQVHRLENQRPADDELLLASHDLGDYIVQVYNHKMSEVYPKDLFYYFQKVTIRKD
jgi:hypothetical protein